MAFIRNQEDFTCNNCGDVTRGTGYTNHCHNCLYSKHVDVDPGDRQADCGGMMQPIRIEQEGKEETVVHQCVQCSHVKRNKIQDSDKREVILAIARQNASEQ